VSKNNKKGQQEDAIAKAVPLAIVGIGCLFPKANDANSYWTNIRDGVDAIGDIPDTHWKPEDYFDADKNAPDMTYARRGGFIDAVDFDPLLYGFSPNNIEATDSTQLLGMVVARQALLDAGYATAKDSDNGRAFDRDRCSVILGVTGTLELVIPLGARLGHPIWRKALSDAGIDKETADDIVERISDGYVPWQENSFPGLLGNVAAGRIANRFDLGGTNCVVDAACASSLSALHMAAMELYAGRSDMAITGGFDTFNDIFMYMCFSKTPALSPTGNSKPFDLNGDGTILGEGLGAVILKRLDDAKRDGDQIYAVLKGIGSSSDGRGNAIYAPSANGQTKALRDAYEHANVNPRTIELLEAHGTGTKVGDAVEAEALSAVYREAEATGSWCAIGSVKSMIGHTKAAAGVAGLIKIAMALKYKVLPPTIKVEQPLEILQAGQAPVYVNATKRPWISGGAHPRRAALSAFGFGGSNFHCVLEEVESEKAEIEWDGQVLLFGFSGNEIAELTLKLGKTDHEKAWDELRCDAARSLQSYDISQPYRLTLVVTKETKLEKLIKGVNSMFTQHADKKSWSTPDGAYFASGKPVGHLAMLFPGQGSQYTNMLIDLACQFPQMQGVLAEAQHVFSEHHGGQGLNDLVYPVAAFTDEAKAEDENKLRATQHAQPAIGATSVGAMSILQHFGVVADATAGHSFGELPALCAAGIISFEDLHKLANKRGELMQEKDSDHGAMMVVSASAAVVHEFLEAEPLDLIIANNNTPSQVVLSGASDQIDGALARFQERGVAAKKLPVSAAFHSIYVSDAEKPYAEYMQDIEFKPGQITVYANTTSEAYPDDVEKSKALLAGQLAKPVEFVAQIENMHDAGIRTFVEVGPGKTLTAMVKSILGEKEHQAIALDASRGKRGGQFDLACLLAQLSVLGHKVDLVQWDVRYLDTYIEDVQTKKSLMTIPVGGANYVKPRATREAAVRKAVSPANVSTQTSATETSSTQVQHAPNTVVTGPVSEALQITQQSIITLQKMQEQTAHLHKQYLEGQAASQQNLQQLIQQQNQLLTGGPVTPSIDNTATQNDFVMRQADTEIEAPTPANPPEVSPVREETSATGTGSNGHYETLLLEVVADKTGYPVDMLSMDMSLDTDLGIDSIKRVEILSALQEKLPGATRVQPEDLGTFQMLKHIVEFLAADVPVEERETSLASQSPVVESTNLQEVLLEVVADKTGYPIDMLNLDMNMDTDLGIDSIKRVEILSGFQEKMPEAPTVNPEDLATLHTLQQIVDFMQSHSTPDTVNETPKPGTTDNNFEIVLLEVVADKTGYPEEMLNLDMNMDSDLGIDFIKRVEILSAFQEKMPEAPTVNPEDLATLQTLQQIVDHMAACKSRDKNERVPETTGAVQEVNTIYRSVVEVLPLISTTRSSIPLEAGSLILVSDDGSDLPQKIGAALEKRKLRAEIIAHDAPINDTAKGLIILAPENPEADFNLFAFQLLQRAADTLKRAGKDSASILLSVTRLGGAFGFEALSRSSPISGGLAGLLKTADKEWENVHCKALDIPANRSSVKLATTIVDEALTQGPLETGIKDDGLCYLSLNTSMVEDSALETNPFGTDDVIIITGGARGVTAEVAVAMAQSFNTHLLLLGRSPLPSPEAKYLSGINEEAAIKKTIVAYHAGEKLAPADVQEAYRKILANREITDNIKRMEDCGVGVLYQSVDVRDKSALSDAIKKARNELGNIAGIIHGAGVLADRLIEDKTMEQFQQVYSTKVDGLQAMLEICDKDKLKVIALFSSLTARLGRKGQVDYAMANEVLNKIAQQQERLRRDCRVLSVNWGPWDGGMVTPQLKQLFKSEGVGVISLKGGADYLSQEISRKGPVEIVVLGSELEEQSYPEEQSQMMNENLHLISAHQVNINEFPVLKSHIMNGKAVLPAALMAEWLAHGAMHNHPGLSFVGFNDFRILKGVVLGADEKIDLQILAGQTVMKGDEDFVHIELRSGTVLHASAEVVLGTGYPQAAATKKQTITGEYPFKNKEYYTNGHLFHGPALQCIDSIAACSDEGITGDTISAPSPSEWMTLPMRSSWLSDPMILDASFQMMILWSFQQAGMASLPTRITRYRQFQRRMPKDGARLHIHIDNAAKHSAIANIDILDKNNILVARIEGYECVIDASLNEAFTRNTLVQSAKA
jgi:acyl transferase domain-containing protein/NAD(P)-dependent dehydrogenase (short-subunit alcohol dehydrogenase family)